MLLVPYHLSASSHLQEKRVLAEVAGDTLGFAGFNVEYRSGIGVGGTYASFRVSIQNLQVDDQMPFTR